MTLRLVVAALGALLLLALGGPAEAVVISGGALYGGSEQAFAACTLSNFSGGTIDITQALLRNQNGVSVKEGGTCGATLPPGRACKIWGSVSPTDHVSCKFKTNGPAGLIRGILHTKDLGGAVLNSVNLYSGSPNFISTGATIGGPLQENFVCTFTNQGTTPTVVGPIVINDGNGVVPGNNGETLTTDCFDGPLAPGRSCAVRGLLTSETEHLTCGANFGPGTQRRGVLTIFDNGGNPLNTSEMLGDTLMTYR